MCGIVGFLTPTAAPKNAEYIGVMTDCLSHRGPDDRGEWISDDGRTALGHRRLSILDLSDNGRQPMQSASGRYTIVYNGEVYNFRELREELGSDYPFRGQSDTEVLLAAFEARGVEDAVKQFRGMFAFAVWDEKERCLWLARDRVGKKPLYYSHSANHFVFGSEIRALTKSPWVASDISREALALYLKFSYVPAPCSIYENVWKLRPGTLLSVKEDSPLKLNESLYWDFSKIVADGGRNSLRFETEETAVDQLEQLLSEAVRMRMISDVPLGAFLSGGIDSSTIVSLMQKESSRPVKTFSIGTHHSDYNEAQYAKQVASHLGTDHTELYITESEAQEVIPELPRIYDEPFADTSQIPTYLVSKLARKDVTVCLSGDGGDELFGGYNRYLFIDRYWKRLRWIPAFLRRALGAGLHGVSLSQWEKLMNVFAAVTPKGLLPALPAEKIHKVGSLLKSANGLDVQDVFFAKWPDVSDLVIGARPMDDESLLCEQPPEGLQLASQQMWVDMQTYLVDDILVKLDRATMAVGLEGRAPLLDQRIVEFAWSLPQSMKIRNGKGKYLLRKVLSRHVPENLIDRPKMGFDLPIAQWLRQDLRNWAEARLDSAVIRRQGFLNVHRVEKVWKEHLAGRVDRSGAIWNVLMFQEWLANNSA